MTKLNYEEAIRKVVEDHARLCRTSHPELAVCDIHKEKHQELWADQWCCESCFIQTAGGGACLICSTIDDLDARGHCFSCSEAQKDEFRGFTKDDRSKT